MRRSTHCRQSLNAERAALIRRVRGALSRFTLAAIFASAAFTLRAFVSQISSRTLFKSGSELSGAWSHLAGRRIGLFFSAAD
jgi:hypothetical protein